MSERVHFPMPHIGDCLHRVKGSIFSQADLSSGFHQIPIAKCDRKFYAFSTPSRHWQMARCPQGELNATSSMNALMQITFRNFDPRFLITFLDDILMASETYRDHLHLLDEVLSALERAGLKLNPEKSKFCQTEVVVLGFLLSASGLKPDPHNISKILSWPVPKNLTETRGFLGLVSFYRQFIKSYSHIAAPLTDLCKKDVPFHWGIMVRDII